MSRSTPSTSTLSIEVMTEIIKVTTSILDLHELLKTAVNLLQQKFNFDYVGLYLVDVEGKWAELQAGSGQTKFEQGYKVQLGADSPVSGCISAGQPHFLADTQNEPSPADHPRLPEIRSEAVLPLVARDAVIGAMLFQSRQVAAFSEQNLAGLQIVAVQLAAAIENARMFEHVAFSQKVAEDLLHETIALQQLSQSLSGTLKIGEILDIFFQNCTKVLGFDYVIFSLVDPQQHVKAVGGVGVSAAHLKRTHYPLNSNDITADIIRTGHTEMITGDDPRFDREIFQSEGMAEWGMRVFTPVKLRQENIGLVEIGYNKNVEADIQDSQIRLLRAFIDQTALALDNAQRYEASQRAIRREALLKEFATKVRASTNLDTILQTAVKEIGEAMGSRRTYIHLVSPSTPEQTQQAKD